MSKFTIVKYHVLSAIRAAMAEFDGYQQEADKLRAQGNLRLMLMDEEELRELARMLSYLPSRPAEIVYDEIKKAIEDQKIMAAEWIGSFGVEPHTMASKE